MTHNEFISIWEEQLKEVNEALNQLSFFVAESLGSLYPGPIVDFERRKRDWYNWKKWVEYLDPKEKAFFKDGWYPIWDNREYWFVDLSRNNYPLIGYVEFWDAPTYWYHFDFFDSIFDLIKDVKGGRKSSEIKKRYCDSYFQAQTHESEKRYHKRWDGLIPLWDIENDEMFEPNTAQRFNYLDKENLLLIFGAKPLALNLFRHNAEIELVQVHCDYQTEIYTETFEKINHLRQFILLLQTHGQDHFTSFHIYLPTFHAQVHHDEKNELIIIEDFEPTSDKQFFESLIDVLEKRSFI
jgi:hypothetical protein